MRRFIYLVILPVFLFADSVPASFADMVENLIPAVVNVSTEQKIPTNRNRGNIFPNFPQGHLFEEFRDFFDKFSPFMEEDNAERNVVSLGSGFVINENGIIVTNRHVITSQDGSIASNITITFNDNSQLKAKVLETDIRTDLAVLRVKPKHKLKYVEFADSDKSKVGDWVIAIGNPFGLGGSVSAGIVSARGRDINLGHQQTSDFIQTDAAINRGNSGGPLFDLSGKVIGINTAIISPSGGNVGIGFALPSNIASPVVERLAAGKQVERGWIGVKVQAVTQEIADSVGQKQPHGALVVEVMENSPAKKAGIEVGDVITRFNGNKIEQMRNLLTLVGKTKTDSVVDITVMRNSGNRWENVSLKLKVEKLEENTKGSALSEITKEYEELGIKVGNLSSDIRAKFKINDKVKKGIIILESRDRTLYPGDVIVRVGSSNIENLGQFDEIVMSEKKKNSSLLLLINRHGENVFVGIKFAK
ncbi:MAG: Do family serine endopeptidase [Rickettsiaceae bacterium H1]|nr:Do family serine endopeptidase [Rickettsiaceae bacterium H1]